MAIRSFLARRTRSYVGVAVRRPIATLFVVAGTMLVGTGIMIVAPSGVGAVAADAAVAAYRPDVASLLDTRSPGSRRYGWLIDTKQDRIARPDDPVERVLSSVRRRPTAMIAGDPLLGGLGADTVLIPDQTGQYDVTSVDPGATTVVAGGGGAPIGGVIGGGQGGGGGGGGGSNSSPDPITGPVPEPATWMTMMLGFGLLGAMLRRRRSIVAPAR